MSLRRLLVGTAVLGLVMAPARGAETAADGDVDGGVDLPFDLVIAHGRVMDPETGLDAVRHVGIRDGVIEVVRETPLAGLDTFDASGRVVAPGFIDLNTHQHGPDLFRLRAADGVTAVLNLEGGAVDIQAYYASHDGKALIHYGASLAHGELRRLAQGDDGVELHGGVADWPGINATRDDPELDHLALSPDELERLDELVDEGLRNGAVGVGFGIAYAPGATHSEILRVIGTAASHLAPAHVHLRDFHSTRDWDQLYELFGVAIYTGGRIQAKHLNSHMGSFTAEALEFLDRARLHGLQLTTECYPYIASSTFIDSGLSDDWQSWPDDRFHRYEWPPTGERLTRETWAKYRAQGGIIVIHPPSEESAERQRQALRDCYGHPLPMVASDGAWDSGETHPRVAGTNSRVLGRYVREEGVLTLMEALRKMSLAPAEHLEPRLPEMSRKGRVQPGADADLVVFDPDTVDDRATYREPLRPPVGIDLVVVDGVPVVRDGEIVAGVAPGRPLRAPAATGDR